MLKRNLDKHSEMEMTVSVTHYSVSSKAEENKARMFVQTLCNIF